MKRNGKRKILTSQKNAFLYLSLFNIPDKFFNYNYLKIFRFGERLFLKLLQSIS